MDEAKCHPLGPASLAATDPDEPMADVPAHPESAWDARRLVVSLEPLSPWRLRVRLSGELDVAAAAPVRQRLIEAIDRCRAIVLDLSDVSFIDSTGLAALVGANNHAQNVGTTVVVIQPLPPQPRRLFEVTDALSLLGVESPTEAPGD